MPAFNAGFTFTYPCSNHAGRRPFVDLYQRETPGYGLLPSGELASYLKQVKPKGEAWDLGAGAGRNTLALARAGLHVSAFDLSVTGIQEDR